MSERITCLTLAVVGALSVAAFAQSSPRAQQPKSNFKDWNDSVNRKLIPPLIRGLVAF